MDPDANVRERIALLKQTSRTAADTDRLDELDAAYREWRRNGGFPACTHLLDELLTANLSARSWPEDCEALPPIGARVTHYTDDGDTGLVTGHDATREGKPYALVAWEVDGPCGHFADELRPADPS